MGHLTRSWLWLPPTTPTPTPIVPDVQGIGSGALASSPIWNAK